MQQTSSTTSDIQNLTDDVRALLAATAQSADEKVVAARNRLESAMETGRNLLDGAGKKSAREPKRPTRRFAIIPIIPLVLPWASAPSWVCFWAAATD